jgi:hypothetical protein
VNQFSITKLEGSGDPGPVLNPSSSSGSKNQTQFWSSSRQPGPKPAVNCHLAPIIVLLKREIRFLLIPNFNLVLEKNQDPGSGLVVLWKNQNLGSSSKLDSQTWVQFSYY